MFVIEYVVHIMLIEHVVKMLSATQLPSTEGMLDDTKFLYWCVSVVLLADSYSVTRRPLISLLS